MKVSASETCSGFSRIKCACFYPIGHPLVTRGKQQSVSASGVMPFPLSSAPGRQESSVSPSMLSSPEVETLEASGDSSWDHRVALIQAVCAATAGYVAAPLINCSNKCSLPGLQPADALRLTSQSMCRLPKPSPRCFLLSAASVYTSMHVSPCCLLK